MHCFHWELVFSLFLQFSIIWGGRGSRTRQSASSQIVAEMCGNINTNESASMQGEWDSCLFSCNSCPPFGTHFSSPALPLRSCRQQKQRRDVQIFSCAFSAANGTCAIGLLYTCMCCGCDWFTQIVVEKSFLFSKNILGQLTLIGTHFYAFFCSISPSLFWNFSKKSVIQELRTRKNGLIERFSRVGPIITHSRESSNSQRDPQDHADP